ncbi:MAG: VWA domain-containing protein [Candidatus Bathyarchaeota archaeon]|nr:VWA domain-containing protein [Candidatus Bathyarchaeota archaeon]
MQRKRLVFPFSAIVGLDKLKLAILINAINPKIGGLLIRGPKGSGKSTVVRALADILPKIKVVKDCPFNCSPYDPSNMCPKCSERYKSGEKLSVEEGEMVVVDLPLGCTEDRVVGSLDVEKAIKHGIEALEPGILAEANQNILYVDEVNLLPDHIADDLLDAAATGWNIVEREGISVSHPSRFIFIGTMNPEEGELRPQLLDRFALSVTVERITSVEDRIEVVKKNMEFEADPEKFYEKNKSLQEELRNRILQARKVLENVVIPNNLLESICKTCLELKVDGLRPDIVIAKAASALAAFENRTEVALNDILVAAELALSHRTREGGFLEPAAPQEIKEVFAASVKKVFHFEKTGETTKKEVEKRKFLKGRAVFWVKKDATKEEEERTQKETRSKKIQRTKLSLMFLLSRFTGGVWGIAKRLKKSPKDAPVTDGLQVGGDKLQGETYEEKIEKKKTGTKAIPTVSDAAQSTDVSKGYSIISSLEKKVVSPSKFFLKMGKIKIRRQGVYAGKHAQAITTLHKGKPYGWRIPHGKPTDIHLPATIREAARKQKNRQKPLETALKICLEDVREKLRMYKAPLTMIFLIDLSGSMLFNLEAVKEALLKLHSDAYRSRDRVGIVALKGLRAEAVQHPTTNLRVVANKLVNLRISGYTPLATGMLKTWEVLKEAKRRDPSTVPVMVVITDGGANVPLKRSLETGEVREIEEVRVIVREYEDLSVKDVMSVSRLVKREGIHTIVINTNPHMYGRETYGFFVTEAIASITKGSHHIIGRLTTDRDIVENMIEQIRQDQRKIINEKLLE